MDALVEYFYWDYFGKRSIVLKEDGVEVSYSNLIKNNKWKIKYNEFNTNFEEGKSGETGWGNIAVMLIVIAVILLFAHDILWNIGFNIQKNIRTLGDIFVFAGISLYFVRFIKHDYVYFNNKNGNCILSIKSNQYTIEFIKKLKIRILTTIEEISL
jgi:hypothetical protein